MQLPKLNVALLGPVYPYRSGEAQSNTILATNLAKSHNFRAFSFKRLYPAILYPGKNQKYDSKKKPGFRTEYCIDSINPLNWLLVFLKLKKEKPDVIIVTWWTVFLSPCLFSILLLARLFSRSKICIFCHNVLPHERSIFNKALTLPVLKLGHYFIVLSTQTMSELKALVPSAKVQKIIEPTYDSYFMLKKIPKKTAQKKAGVSGNVVLFFGLIREYKGLEFLLRAVKCADKKIGLKLLVVGEFWEDKEKFLSIIEKEGISEKVKIVDRFVADSEVPVFFSACDLVVLPYVSATYSGIIQLAYGFGKPVVVSDVEGLTDYVDDGWTGFIVEPRKPEELAKAFEKFYQTDREKISRNINRKKRIFRWGPDKEKVLFHGIDFGILEKKGLMVSCGLMKERDRASHSIAEERKYFGGKLAGIAGVEKRYWIFPSFFLAVGKKYRNRGIGRALTQKVLEKWNAPLFLTVARNNAIAKRIYLKSGFRKISGWRKIRGEPSELMLWLPEQPIKQ